LDTNQSISSIKATRQLSFLTLHEEALFNEPPRAEDCPICFVPLPEALPQGQTYFSCCGKNLCIGCVFTDAKQNPCDNRDKLAHFAEHSLLNIIQISSKNSISG
jgi:hypothetical protein